MELTASDAGAEHSVGIGEELVVRLDENRTTGFRWHLSVPEGAVTVDDDAYEAAAPGRPGAGGTRTFRLRATQPGTHRLGASLRRSWGAGQDDAPELEFAIRAR